MNILESENGSVVDLDSREGCWKYLGDFLNSHAASSALWAALEALHRTNEDEKIIKLEDETQQLRKWMWINHGCGLGSLYGDDGEMQCNNTHNHRVIDFRRDSIEWIKELLTENYER